ncbi:hypothetical protein B6U74_02575 [Candidatus Bathyarchaeota archaeon ex4484_205]|nr:MAG: hypothetical protein B6U74_02575 [Candidatus Bathyarchaeota archaeon ex4484_205]
MIGESLLREVVDGERCMICLGCVAVCPVNALSFNRDEERVKLTGECIDCGLCTRICPAINFEKEKNPLGKYRRIVRARSTIRFSGSNDGGAVTALVITALEEGVVDEFIGVGGTPSTPKPVKIHNSKEAIEAAGSKYSPSLTLLLKPKGKIGVVYLPCTATALSRSLIKGWKKVELSIGLFCGGTFHRKELRKYLEKKGITGDIIKEKIAKGKYMAYLKHGNVEIPLKKLKKFRVEGCNYCPDYTCWHSDISAGSIGSPEGWTTLIVRSEKGETLLRKAVEKEYIEIGKATSEDITRIEKYALKKFNQA